MIEEKKKVFELVPAQDELTNVILRTRREVLTHPDLADGAKALFCLLLDWSLWPGKNKGPGRVAISTTALCKLLHRSARAIWGWKRQLAEARFIWVKDWFMPNTWPIHLYNITALVPPDPGDRQPTEDGSWGNGRRMTTPTDPGARKVQTNGSRSTKQHLTSHVEQSELRKTEENQGASDVQQHPSDAVSCHPTDAVKQHPTDDMGRHPTVAQNSIPPQHETTSHRSTKGHPTVAGNGICEPQQTTPLIEAGVVKEEGRDHLDVQRTHALARKFRKESVENRFLLEVAETIETWQKGAGKAELDGSGAWWRLRFREDPDKAYRVLADIGSMIKERRITLNPGAAAVDLWGRLP